MIVDSVINRRRQQQGGNNNRKGVAARRVEEAESKSDRKFPSRRSSRDNRKTQIDENICELKRVCKILQVSVDS